MSGHSKVDFCNDINEVINAAVLESMDPATKSVPQRKYSKTVLVVMRNYALSRAVHPCIKDSERLWRLGLVNFGAYKQCYGETEDKSYFKNKNADRVQELNTSRGAFDHRSSLSSKLLPAFAKNRISKTGYASRDESFSEVTNDLPRDTQNYGNDVSEKGNFGNSAWKKSVSDKSNSAYNRLPMNNGPGGKFDVYRPTPNDSRCRQHYNNKQRNSEPEWFSCSVTKDDFIELHGFEDSNDGLKSLNRVKLTEHPNPNDADNYNSKPLQYKESKNKNSKTRLDSVLNVDPLNSHSQTSGEPQSRFSQWFDQNEDVKSNSDEGSFESKPDKNLLQAFLERGKFSLPPDITSIDNFGKPTSNQKKPAETMKSLQELEADMRKLNIEVPVKKENNKIVNPRENQTKTPNLQPTSNNMILQGIPNIGTPLRMAPPMEPYPIQMLLKTQNEQLLRQQQVQNLAFQPRFPLIAHAGTHQWNFQEFGAMQRNQPFNDQQFGQQAQPPHQQNISFVCMPPSVLLLNDVQARQMQQTQQLQQQQSQFNIQSVQNLNISNGSNEQTRVVKPQMSFASEIELDLIRKEQQRSYEYSLQQMNSQFQQSQPQFQPSVSNFQRPNVNLQQFFQQHYCVQNLGNQPTQPNLRQHKQSPELSRTDKNVCVPLSLEEFEKKLFRNNQK